MLTGSQMGLVGDKIGSLRAHVAQGGVALGLEQVSLGRIFVILASNDIFEGFFFGPLNDLASLPSERSVRHSSPFYFLSGDHFQWRTYIVLCSCSSSRTDLSSRLNTAVNAHLIGSHFGLKTKL